jgi:hypothetical protein
MEPSWPLQACNGIALPSVRYIQENKYCLLWESCGKHKHMHYGEYPENVNEKTDGTRSNHYTLKP